MDARARGRWAASTVGALVAASAIVASGPSATDSSLAAPNAALDQSNPARQSACRYVGWVPDSADEWVAETFTAGASGSLTDVVLWLAISNPQIPVAITRVDATGKPDVSATLASTVLAVEGGPFKALGVSFPTPARVEAGKQYAVVLYAPVRDAWAWQADLGSSLPDPDGKPCADGANAGGRIWLSSDSSFGPDGDFFFQTYVVPARHVTVQKMGTGTGVVKDATGVIDCGSSCSGEFAQGQTATLTATADAGSTFSGWTGGGCTGIAPTCSTSVGADVSVTATFARRLVTLSVSKVGRGTVASAPGVLACARACRGTFVPGPVKLTAKPARGWRFARWKGACRGTKPVCRLALAGTTSAGAIFARA